MIGTEDRDDFDVFLTGQEIEDVRQQDLHGTILNKRDNEVVFLNLGLRTNLERLIYVDFDFNSYTFFIGPEMYVYLLRNGAANKKTLSDFEINIYNIQKKCKKRNAYFKAKREISYISEDPDFYDPSDWI